MKEPAEDTNKALVLWHEIMLIGIALLLIFYCYFTS